MRYRGGDDHSPVRAQLLRMSLIHKRANLGFNSFYSILGFFQLQQIMGGIMASNFSIGSLHLMNLQVSEYPQTPSFSIFPCSSILPRFKGSIRPSLSINKLHSLPLQSSSPVSVCEDSSIEHSFRVSYLMNRFGWTPEFANSKAKYLIFKTPEKPDRVLSFLKNYGFTETQISTLVRRNPNILTSVPSNSFLPKLAFLTSLGLSRTDVTGFVTEAPNFLKISLEKKIVPGFNRIADLVKSKDEAVKIVKQHPIILFDNLDEDKIQILREVGVPDEHIVASMIYSQRALLPAPDLLRKVVEEVKEMGFNPRSKTFLLAVRNMSSMSKSTWEDKLQVLKKYGWSDREIRLAFRSDPKYVTLSTNKLDGTMDFLVNRMGLEATTIASYSYILCLSLKKTIVPRGLVYQTLLEKGLWKRQLSIRTLFRYSEDKFVTEVIKPYENEAPELLDLYKELLDLGKDLQI